MVVLFAAIIYSNERKRVVKDEYEKISAIADLKIDDIQNWRQYNISHVQTLANNPFIVQAVEEIIHSVDSSPFNENLFRHLDTVKRVFKYSNVIVVAPAGNVLINLRDHLPEPGQALLETLKKANSLKNEFLSDLFVCPEGSVYVDAVSPIKDLNDQPFAYLILRINAGDYLRSDILNWPTPSMTGEIVLIQNIGDEIIIVSRRTSDSASFTSIRKIIEDSLSPCAKAFRAEGFYIGKDYNGNQTLSDLRVVENSNLLMVTKIDLREVYEELNRNSIFLLLFFLMCIFFAGAVTSFLYRNRQNLLLKKIIEAKSKISSQEKELSTIIDSLQEGLIAVDENDVITFVNPKFCEMLEYRHKELVDRKIYVFFHKKSDVERIKNYNKERQKGKSGSYELEMVKKSGSIGIFTMNASPLKDSKGKIIGSMATCLDVTEHKMIEKSAVESESKYKMLVKNMQEGLLFADNEDIIQFINPTLCEKLGYTEEELIGKRGLDFLLNPDGKEFVMERTKKRMEGLSEQYEIELIKKNGEEAVFLVNAAPIKNDKEVVIGSLSTMLDITNRKKAEDELKNHQSQMLSIFEGIDQPIYVSDPETYEVLFINNALKSSFGEVLGTKCYEYLQGRDSPCPFCTNSIIFGEFFGRSYIWKYQNKKNQRWYNCTDKAIKWYDGRLVRYQMANDITELQKAIEKSKETEEKYLQAQKMEAVGRLAGGIAHDFNNMLSVISGNADLILTKEDLPRDIREGLSEIIKASEHSTTLVRQLLAFARKQTAEPETTDLNKIISDMTTMLKRLIGENIELVLKPSKEICPIFIDPAQIDQIVANLVVNSRDAITGNGKIIIETSLLKSAEITEPRLQGFPLGDLILLSVTDNGDGMDKEIQEHLFEPFFTTKPKGKGTGLGLSTIYGIVKQNKGFINVYSEPGKGTTVKIYFPRSEKEPKKVLKKKDAEKKELLGKTVLLVEDEETLLKLNIRILQICGFKVLSAQSPFQALEIAKTFKSKIDLLITDIVMPRMSGQELWNEISVISPETKCLFISGYTSDIIDNQGVLMEGIHFLQKPFTKDTLSQKIEEMFSE
ncbi:PAS domain S-box protein [candidate division WOR-3 bacterium]|nr:PAS domain S-box protein [candidate division WOR-3 bacterium]